MPSHCRPNVIDRHGSWVRLLHPQLEPGHPNRECGASRGWLGAAAQDRPFDWFAIISRAPLQCRRPGRNPRILHYAYPRPRTASSK